MMNWAELTPIEQRVIELRRKHSETWRKYPEGYWLARFVEEVGELGAAIALDHEHSPDYELAQIAAIAINWLDMRLERGVAND